MTSHDVQLLLVDLALILVLARLLGAVARRLGQPQVVGEILAGLLLGPSLFSGAVPRALSLSECVTLPSASVTCGLPTDVQTALRGLAEVGLVLFMFIIGYELDRELIRGRERIAASVSLGSIAVPLVLGFLLGIWLAHRHHVEHTVPFALFVGAAMSVTAFPVLARILADRGLHRTRIGGLAIASAAVDDVAAWTLLAVVLTIAGSPSWHIALAPVYLAVMFFVVRPLLRQLGERYRRQQRLTPDLLAVVLVGLLLSAYATDWFGVHFIFGAFIFGTAMPRQDAGALRENILERLEQISVLLLLPVFFVVAGLSVDVSKIDGHAAVELGAILAVAIVGKFVGAYLGASSQGLSPRHAAVLGTLMNTRGLTEIVILTAGLQIGVIDTSLFGLMVLMALITTAMTGPLLRRVYPPRLVQRDLSDAARAALAASNAYRVLVVLASGADSELVETGLDLAASRLPAEVVLSRLVPQPAAKRLEVGTGLGQELLLMTGTLAELHVLAARGAPRGVDVTVYAQFSDDLPHDLTQHMVNADPDLVLLPASAQLAPHALMPRTVVSHAAGPPTPSAVAVSRTEHGADAAAALQVATQIAVSRNIDLVLVGGQGRRDRAALAELGKHGIAATAGPAPADALFVGTPADPDAHLVVHARPDDEVDNIDEWATLVSAEGRHERNS